MAPARESQSDRGRALSSRRSAKRALPSRLGAAERALLDAAPVGLFLCDRDGTCVFVNREAAKLFDASPEQLLGAGWQAHLHAADRAALAAASEGGSCPGAQRGQEYRLVGGDGRVRWVTGRIAALHDARGEVDGYIGSLIDIDDRKRAEAEREEMLAREQESRRDAERASRTKDEFLATFSHELRTPLNAIVGWADILRTEGVDEETAREALDAILRNALAQSQLIEDLIDLTRIERGAVRLALEPCDPAAVATAALETVRPAAQAKRISLDLATGETRAVLADPVRLRQVIWNLLSNAVKFTPRDGSIEVRIADAHDAVELRVADDGIGIDASALPHLFERFWQDPRSVRRGDVGLGLGLAIARQLVDLHGGTIAVESAGAGRGSTFIVRLPYPSDAISA